MRLSTWKILCNELTNVSLVIPLDNGCVYTKKHKRLDYTKTGRLCAFNLDTRGLIAIENVEK